MAQANDHFTLGGYENHLGTLTDLIGCRGELVAAIDGAEKDDEIERLDRILIHQIASVVSINLPELWPQIYLVNQMRVLYELVTNRDARS